MKKQLLLGLGIALASPFVLAQSVGGTDLNAPQKNQNQNRTSPLPAAPGAPSSGNDDTGLQAPTTDQSGTTSGSARTKNAHGGAAVNPNSGHGSAYGSGGSEFGTLDANGDGRLSRDEIRGNAGLAGRLDQLDRNRDGTLSRAEYATGFRASPNSGANSGSSSSTYLSGPSDSSGSAKDPFNRGKQNARDETRKGAQEGRQNVKDQTRQNKDDLDRSLNGGG